MEKALKEKFRIPEFQQALRETRDIIGEATQNKTWGIGTTLGKADCFDSKSWKGNNLMGKLLMKVKTSMARTQAGNAS